MGILEGSKLQAACDFSQVKSATGVFEIEWERSFGNEGMERVLHHSISPNEETVQYLSERIKPRLHGSFLNSTVSILNIDSTAIEDTGKYICYVNGIKRRAFTFFVCVPFSKIVMGFEPEKPVEGDHIQITCQAGTGFPKPLVQWLAAGNDITHKANIMMGNSIDHKILVRTSVMVKAKRGVRYTCSIWNKYIENLLVDWVVPVPGITVQTPIKDILGIRGKSVLLICDIDIPSNDPVTIAELGFYWVNRDLNMTERLAYSFVNEKQHLEEQDPMFAGRASLSWENFLRGSADLKLANVSIDDMGDYICRVKKGNELMGEAFLELRVASPYSKPTIKYSTDPEVQEHSNVLLTCYTEGGFPLGSIRWLSNNDKDVTSHSRTSIKLTNGHFDISSDLTVSVSQGTHFTCTISNPWLEVQPSSTLFFVDQ
eukprot:gi/632968132/ref/XP_007900360.1/ PREDICTED: uncharacterized protein LOC103184258 [Callorhinchus milii]